MVWEAEFVAEKGLASALKKATNIKDVHKVQCAALKHYLVLQIHKGSETVKQQWSFLLLHTATLAAPALSLKISLIVLLTFSIQSYEAFDCRRFDR